MLHESLLFVAVAVVGAVRFAHARRMHHREGYRYFAVIFPAQMLAPKK